MPRRLCKGCDRHSIPADAPKTCKACSIPCSIVIGKKLVAQQRAMQERSRAKQAKAEKQAHKKQKREFYANDYKKQFSLTKTTAQRLANRLDAAHGCICCTTERGSQQFCGGHFKTAGAHPELALDLRNIHGQANQRCNKQKSGNISGDKHSHGYKAGLIMRYGQWIIDYLESYHAPRKRTCDELIAMRAEYAAEIKRLEKGLPPSRNWRELPQAQELAA